MNETSSKEKTTIKVEAGNIDVLIVQILSEINQNLKRIADTLEK